MSDNIKQQLRAFAIYKKAQEAFGKAEHEKAINLCYASLEINKDDNPLAFSLLGRIYEELENFPKAIEYYEKEEENRKDIKYPRSLLLKRSQIKEDFSEFIEKGDLASLIALEKIYAIHELQWPWFELRDFADRFMKAGDYQRSLTWINAAMNSRMLQMSKESPAEICDSSLASLYVIKGTIYLKLNDFIMALQEFLTATWQYEYKPTKGLNTKIGTTLKKLHVQENIFNDIVEVTKLNGIDKGFDRLKNTIIKKPESEADHENN